MLRRDTRYDRAAGDGVGLEPTPMPHEQRTIRRAADGRPTARPPWRQLVREALVRAGGNAPLQAIYAALERQVPKDSLTPTWKAKVRQQLQLDPQTTNSGRGMWSLSDDRFEGETRR